MRPVPVAVALAREHAPLTAWAVSRALVIGLGIAGGVAFGDPTRGVDPAVPALLAQLGGWDTTWYLDIARHGYEHDHGQVGSAFTNLAFFPLLPAAMALLLAAGINPFLGALVLVHLAFLGALAAMHSLTRRRLGEAAAVRATWTLALLPPAAYCSLAYTEAIALACAVGGALAVAAARPALGGAAGAAAALARPPGLAVGLLTGLLALRGPRGGRVRRVALAAAPAVAALGGFLAWMALARGSATLPLEAQGGWDRGQLGIGLVTAAPGRIADAWELVSTGTVTAAWSSTARDIVFLALYGWLLARLWRREGGLRSPWVAYSAVVLVVPLLSGSVASMARMGLMAFPLVWPLSDWVWATRRRRRLCLAAAVAVTALLVAQLEIRAP